MQARMHDTVDAMLGRRHTDKEFPPDARSIGAWRGLPSEKVDKQTYWDRLRASRLFEDTTFQFRVELMQGNVGNCWLIAAFMCAAERHPQIILNAFVNGKSSTGKWKVRLFDRKANDWQIVVIDDHIPFLRNTRKPLFASAAVSADNWVVVLEKAFAKFVGGYDKLDGGHTAWALNALTGDTVFRFKRYDFAEGAWRRQDICKTPPRYAADGTPLRTTMGFVPTDEAYDSEGTFLLLKAYVRRRALVGASFGVKDEQDAADHAHLFKFWDGTPLRLLRLRNPWGQPEWQGAWANGAPEWQEHPWVTEVCLPYGREAPGCFWMRWEDFAAVFDKLDVCVAPSHLKLLTSVPRKHEHIMLTYKRWLLGHG